MEINMGQNKNKIMLFIIIAIVIIVGTLIYVFRSQLTDVLTGLLGKTPQPDSVEQQVLDAQTRWDKMALRLESSPASGSTVYKDTVINYTATIENKNVGNLKIRNLIFLAKLPYWVEPQIISMPVGSINRSEKGLVVITGFGVEDGQSQTVTFSMKVPVGEIKSIEDESITKTEANKISTVAFLIPGRKPSGTEDELLQWIQNKTGVWEEQQKTGTLEEIEFIIEQEEKGVVEEKTSQSSYLKAEASSLIQQATGTLDEQEKRAIEEYLSKQKITGEVQTVYLGLVAFPPPPEKGFRSGDTINFRVSVTSDYTFPSHERGTMIINLPFKDTVATIVNEGTAPADTVINEAGKITLEGFSVTEGYISRLDFNVLVPENTRITNLNKCIDMGDDITDFTMACTKVSLTQAGIPAAEKTLKEALLAKLDVEIEPTTPEIPPVEPEIPPVEPEVPPVEPEVPASVKPKVVSIDHFRGSDQLVEEQHKKVIPTKKVRKIDEELKENIQAEAGDKIIYELTAENTSNEVVSQYLISDVVSDLEAYADIEKVETLLSDGSAETTTYSDSKVESLVSLDPSEKATTIIQAQIKPLEQWPQDNDKKIINTLLDKQTEVGLIEGVKDEDTTPTTTPTGTTGGATGTKTASVETGIDSSVILVLIYSGLAVIGATLIYLVVRQKA